MIRLGVLGAAAAACVAYGTLVERRWYAVREEELAVLRRPDARLRVLVFADLHHAPGQEHRLAFLQRLAERCAPDLVISGGDNIEHADAIEPVVEVHRAVLEATGAPGVAVLGSHDRYAPRRGNPVQYLRGPSRGAPGRLLDVDRLVAGLRDGGWTVLENACSSVDTRSGRVEVVGLGDPHIDRDDISVVPAATAGDPGAILRLGLVHAPYLRALHAFDRAGFDLALAGHTHGGQLAVPGWGALVSNSDLPPAQAKGTSWIGAGLRLYVSAGLGHSIYYPFRFACRPEATVLDLVGRPS